MSGGYILLSILTGVSANGQIPVPTASQTTAAFDTKAGCKDLQQDMIPNPTSTTDTKREYVYTETNGGLKVTFTHKVFCSPAGG